MDNSLINKRKIGVSIIVPLFNVEEVVLETLESLANQTFQNIEVLLIDDGSTDKTIEIVTEYAKSHPHFKLIEQENAGPAAARNHGLRLTKGEYICFVDSDDILPAHALELMYQGAINHNAELVTGATKRFNSESEWFIPMHVQYNIAKPGFKTILENPELLYSIGPCAKLYHHSLIENTFFPETIRYGEDQPFVLHALLKAKTIYTVEKVVYYYRLRDGESQSLTQSVGKDPLRILNSVFDVFDFGENEIIASKTPKEVAIKYYQRVASIELWASLKAATESKNKTIQIKCYNLILEWFKTKPTTFLNLIPSFRYFLLYSMVDRINFIKKEAKPHFRELITYLWSKQNEEAKNAFQKSYPLYYYASISIIDNNDWRQAKKLSRRFQIRVKLNTPRLVRGLSRHVVFKLASLLPRKNQLVLATERSSKLEGNLLAIYNYMYLNDRPERIYVFIKKGRNWFETIQLYYVLGRVRTIALDDYYNKIYGLKFNRKTNVVQTWHATGAFKKFGFSALGAGDSNTEEFETKAHSPYSEVLVSSPGIIPQYAEAFHKKESQVVPIGVPRTDMFFDDEYYKYINELYRKTYPILNNKKAILYAPTFRGGPDERLNYTVVLDIKKMKEKLGNDYVLILKFHPMIKNISLGIDENDPFIICSNDDINDLMLISDALITDYSSVIFEYSLLERPMYFFSYDVDEYFDERGFYFDYNEMIPGDIYKTTETLITALQEGHFDKEKLVHFRRKFVSSLDGRSTERFIERYIVKEDEK